ncbi:uncharacterized protein LOC120348719 [Nilaparvata lugens]|uniref:uncharacterized protein LOC120348719 n=1 Tax=Nilaparvata lugens TaxID=108931 RepID=UPI00193DD96A|nr:uncharacterized protein LOC120348719 [Nilaparvata lugens]
MDQKYQYLKLSIFDNIDIKILIDLRCCLPVSYFVHLYIFDFSQIRFCWIIQQKGLNVVANRIAKLELEIVKLKEYLENILPQIAGLNKQQPSTETLTTTSIPPLPCNEKEEVENLEVWLESEQNQNLLVQYLGRVGGKTVDYVVRKTLAPLFSNKMAQSYNWTGKNGKNALLQLRIKDIIFRVVCNNKQTE